MFKKILIANRGEIACRVMRTAKRMGIKTVAVYSEADADALHVQEADEAVFVGPPPSAQSYLVAERILQAVKDTGADAVHPGYGFLSEREAFAAAVAKAGATFIGPPPAAIAAMGDKIESKRLAAKAGVNTVPGFLGVIGDAKEAVTIAGDIGYPVMIKASAGGGGKGMRIAFNDREAEEGFVSAQNEARSSFGDDRVFIEKFVEEPRHIEIQVLADAHGNCVYLGERECSIQRRHQKVIEEAPSPLLDAKMRAAMGAQAVQLAKAVGYASAGTVEFIADAKRNFYFLEMNTRLQVEHPVTEMITGLDLVELMIRIAAGEKLPFKQKDISYNGWAIESRVYAEDPLRNFLPSIGRVTRYRPPPANDGVRTDTGIGEGSEISMYYDPMIAKLITHGATRAEAVARMSEALDGFLVRGVNHNIAFLSAVMAHPRFRAGRLSTGFIAEEFPNGFEGHGAATDDLGLLATIAAIVNRRQVEQDCGLSGQTAGQEMVPADDWVVVIDRTEYAVRMAPRAGGYDVHLRDKTFVVLTDWQPGQALFESIVDGAAVIAQVDRLSLGYRLFRGGATVDAQVLSPEAAALYRLMPEKVPPDMSRYLLSPMPGLLIRVAVEAGQEVKAGEELAVVEAMKMENVLRAERDGVVAAVHAKAGDSLEVDQQIVEFE